MVFPGIIDVVVSNLLFPFLEKHDVTGPSQVMWAVHDDIRAMLKKAAADLESDNIGDIVEQGIPPGSSCSSIHFYIIHFILPTQLC